MDKITNTTTETIDIDQLNVDQINLDNLYAILEQLNVLDLPISFSDEIFKPFILLKSEKGSLLHKAIECGNIKLANKLIDGGIDIELKNNYNQTALIISLKHGQPYLAEKLITKGAKFNYNDIYDNSPIYWAQFKGQYGPATHLIIKGATYKIEDFGEWPYVEQKKIFELIELKNSKTETKIETKIETGTKIETELEPKPIPESNPFKSKLEAKKSYPVCMFNVPHLIEHNISFTFQDGQIVLL